MKSDKLKQDKKTISKDSKSKNQSIVFEKKIIDLEAYQSSEFPHRRELDDHFFLDKKEQEYFTPEFKKFIINHRQNLIDKSSSACNIFEKGTLSTLAKDFQFGYILKYPLVYNKTQNKYIIYDFYIPKFFLFIDIDYCDYSKAKQQWQSHPIKFNDFYQQRIKPSTLIYSHKILNFSTYESYNQSQLLYKILIEYFYKFKAPDYRDKRQRLV